MLPCASSSQSTPLPTHLYLSSFSPPMSSQPLHISYGRVPNFARIFNYGFTLDGDMTEEVLTHPVNTNAFYNNTLCYYMIFIAFYHHTLSTHSITTPVTNTPYDIEHTLSYPIISNTPYYIKQGRYIPCHITG